VHPIIPSIHLRRKRAVLIKGLYAMCCLLL
jgi:hypothetical protein